jgi:predicted transcriptional regulator
MKKKLADFYNALQIKKYITAWWLLLYLLAILLVVNYSVIIQFLYSLKIEEYELVRKYLQTFFSWPVIILVVVVWFISQFSESIKIFLENIGSLKAGPVEITQNQRNSSPQDIQKEVVENLEERGTTFTPQQLDSIEQHINNLSNQVQTVTSESQNKDEIIKYLAERAELFEFAYLKYYLVFNTKQALLWFNNINLKTSTKGNFFFSCLLQIQSLNVQAEKEAIFNALLVNGLICQPDYQQIYKITEKGMRFLKYIGFVK